MILKTERFVFTEKSGVILKMPDGAKPEDFFQISQ